MHRLHLNPKVSVSVVFVAALFMSIMDTTIVNVALPSLGRELHTPSTALDAVVVGYLISLAAVIPASGWLGDCWGTRRIFLLALALFSIASALCGLAPNFPLLVGFRVLQGIGGGALTPVGTAMLYRTFPPAQRIQVSRILIIPTVLAPALGPVIGGLLVDQAELHGRAASRRAWSCPASPPWTKKEFGSWPSGRSTRRVVMPCARRRCASRCEACWPLPLASTSKVR